MAALRAGLAIRGPNPAETLAAIVRAEERGLPLVWSTVGGTNPDAVTLFAAAAAKTSTIGLGHGDRADLPAPPDRAGLAGAGAGGAGAGAAPAGDRAEPPPDDRGDVRPADGQAAGAPARVPDGAAEPALGGRRSTSRGRYFTVKASLPAGVSPPKTPLPISALRAGRVPAGRRDRGRGDLLGLPDPVPGQHGEAGDGGGGARRRAGHAAADRARAGGDGDGSRGGAGGGAAAARELRPAAVLSRDVRGRGVPDHRRRGDAGRAAGRAGGLRDARTRSRRGCTRSRTPAWTSCW